MTDAPTHPKVGSKRPATLVDAVCKYLNLKAFYESASPETLRAYAVDLEQAFELRGWGRLHIQPEAAVIASFELAPQTHLPDFTPEALL
ncbi:MAG: hypothetical protein NDI61_10060, partial [Bdellovibrionaceae bacterium]|nr:hypothetical protein [Pseudobdellovibrionaceae bacterium]